MFYFRECTSYVAWKLNERAGTASAPWSFLNYMRPDITTDQGRWSDAENWDDRALALGYTVNAMPAVGAVAHWNEGDQGYGLGHVAYVEAVHADGSVSVSEYNFPSGHNFHVRCRVNPPRFIHIGNGLPQTGSLQVNLTPTGAVAAGAQWQVDGGAWRNSGATDSGLSAGSHAVAFKSVSGWIAPGNQTVMVNANQTTTAAWDYIHVDDFQAPTLTISSPANNAVVAGPSLQVSGTASDNGLGNNGISSVTVNGLNANRGTASAANTANWTWAIDLNPGVNTILVVAKDGVHNQTTKQITVTYQQLVNPDDFNSDGKSDLILQDDNGWVSVWFMNGENLEGANYLNPSRTDPKWRIVGNGDFNDDGNPDLLFQHMDGSLVVWYMDGIRAFDSGPLSPTSSGVDWRAVATGDFNGDNLVDILFQHPGGSVAVWLMNGVNLTSSSLLTPAHPGAGWSAVAAADVDHDGKADVIFQNPEGKFEVWYLDGAKQNGWDRFPANSGEVWRVVGSTDLDGDGSADLIFRNSADASLAVWYLDGIDLIEAALLNPKFAGGTWKIVAP